MKKTNITFAELRSLLKDLGFRATDSTTFEHPKTKTVLLFREQASKDLVSERDMVVVRRQLVDNGLIDVSAFERFLHQISA